MLVNICSSIIPTQNKILEYFDKYKHLQRTSIILRRFFAIKRKKG